MAAETAERKIEENIKKNRQYVLERKGKGVAALLSQGNYLEHRRLTKELEVHPVV